MHPYRERSVTPAPRRSPRPAEEWFLSLLLIAVGGGRVLAATVTRSAIDAGTTLGLLGLALGLWSLLRFAVGDAR